MGFEAIPKIPAGLNIYLSLVPSGEESWLEINCNGEWLVLFSGLRTGRIIIFPITLLLPILWIGL